VGPFPPAATFELCHHGEDWRPPPLEERKAKLERLLAKASAGIQYSEHLDDDGAAIDETEPLAAIIDAHVPATTWFFTATQAARPRTGTSSRPGSPWSSHIKTA
jgi:hypothetical protein